MYLGMSLMLSLGRKYESLRRNPYRWDLMSVGATLRERIFLGLVELSKKKKQYIFKDSWKWLDQ